MKRTKYKSKITDKGVISNPDCKCCGGDSYIQDVDSYKISIQPCQLCLPEMWKDIDVEDPDLFNIDWSDLGPNKEEWEDEYNVD